MAKSCKIFFSSIEIMIHLFEIRMGTDSGDSFRAEKRSAQNEVKGVYSWLDPAGQAHTIAYNSGKNGYRTMPLAQSGIILPPFPYSLSNPKAQSRTDEDIVVIGGPSDAVIDQEEEEESFEINNDESDVEVVQIYPEIPGIQVGTPVAASRPWAGAIAGDNGTADVNPSAQAIVGPGGIAISFPTSHATVGQNGIAISRPSASSTAGHGGVAVAGGLSVATAGLGTPQFVSFGNKGLLLVEGGSFQSRGRHHFRKSSLPKSSAEKQLML